MVKMSDLNDFMECAEWHCSRGLGWQDSKLTHNDVYAIITLLREAEKDAARYRWLRDIARHEYDVDDFFGGSSDSVDGMIDKAMKEKGDE